MKRFRQLSKEEKKKAILFARNILDQEITKGNIVCDEPMDEAWRNKWAIEVAEGSAYTDNGDTDMGIPCEEDDED